MILVNLYILQLSMTSIFTEVVHMFVYGQAEAGIQVWDFLAALNTHWWLFSAFCSGCCLFDTFSDL